MTHKTIATFGAIMFCALMAGIYAAEYIKRESTIAYVCGYLAAFRYVGNKYNISMPTEREFCALRRQWAANSGFTQ